MLLYYIPKDDICRLFVYFLKNGIIRILFLCLKVNLRWFFIYEHYFYIFLLCVMTSKTLMDKVKDFFTVRNSLIVVICILSLILIVQNISRYGWHRPSRNFGWSVTNSRSAWWLGWMWLPGMWWWFGSRRWGN